MAIQAAPRAKARAKAEPVAPQRAAAPIGHNSGDGRYYDREGNPLTRKNPGYRNEFDFKPGEVPEGWEYQWIRHTVHGDPSESELFDMQENGWRPVPHTRHANRFAPGELNKGDLEKYEGKNACILRKGQLLVERPKGLCDEARTQQKREADAAIGQQFRRFAVPLPDNVQRMGLESRGGVARQMDDVQSVRADMKPKYELEIS